MEPKKILELIKEVLTRDDRLVFAYAYGSMIKEKSFRDIDIGIYVKNPGDNPFIITSEIKTTLSRLAKQSDGNFTADDFDVRVINDAPFTFLKRIFIEGLLLVDNDPDLRTDIVEQVSFKYRECAGLLAEVSTG